MGDTARLDAGDGAESIAKHVVSLLDEVRETDIVAVDREAEYRVRVIVSWPEFQGDEARPRGIDLFDMKELEKDFDIRFIGTCLRDTQYGMQPCLAITVDEKASLFAKSGRVRKSE